MSDQSNYRHLTFIKSRFVGDKPTPEKQKKKKRGASKKASALLASLGMKMGSSDNESSASSSEDSEPRHHRPSRFDYGTDGTTDDDLSPIKSARASGTVTSSPPSQAGASSSGAVVIPGIHQDRAPSVSATQRPKQRSSAKQADALLGRLGIGVENDDTSSSSGDSSSLSFARDRPADTRADALNKSSASSAFVPPLATSSINREATIAEEDEYDGVQDDFEAAESSATVPPPVGDSVNKQTLQMQPGNTVTSAGSSTSGLDRKQSESAYEEEEDYYSNDGGFEPESPAPLSGQSTNRSWGTSNRHNQHAFEQQTSMAAPAQQQTRKVVTYADSGTAHTPSNKRTVVHVASDSESGSHPDNASHFVVERGTQVSLGNDVGVQMGDSYTAALAMAEHANEIGAMGWLGNFGANKLIGTSLKAGAAFPRSRPSPKPTQNTSSTAATDGSGAPAPLDTGNTSQSAPTVLGSHSQPPQTYASQPAPLDRFDPLQAAFQAHLDTLVTNVHNARLIATQPTLRTATASSSHEYVTLENTLHVSC